MKIEGRAILDRQLGGRAFTLIEVVVATAIAALVVAGSFKGYNIAGRRAQFSACSLAANTTAMRHMEQVLTAKWVPEYGNTELFSSSLTAVEYTNLCLPISQGNYINCTNYTSISQVSTNPSYAMITVQCVWGFMDLGVFTNTVSVLRAPSPP